MNNSNKYYFFALFLLCLAACKKEAKLTPSDSENSVVRYQFPQGNNVWDKHFEEIHDKFGIYIIYKDITNPDLNRTWTGIVGVSYYGSPVSTAQMSVYDDLLTNQVFPYLNVAQAKRILPPYLFLLDDFHNMFGTYKVPQEDYYDGMDSWVTSITPYQFANLTPDTLRARRCRIISQVITRSVNLGLITEPEGFKTGIDYVTAVVSAAGREADVNYYLNRGFVDGVSTNLFRSALPISSITTVNKTNADFLNYIRIAMLLPEPKFRARYPIATYKTINTRYDMVTAWMKSQYGIDLKGIANGPN